MKAATRARILHEEWEQGIKCQYDGGDRTWTIDTPFECIELSRRRSLKELPTIKLTATEIRQVFRTVTDEIAAMVFEQVAAVQEKQGEKPKVRP